MGNSSSLTKPIQGDVTDIYPMSKNLKSDADVSKITKNRIQVAREMKIRRKRGIKVEINSSNQSPVSVQESTETSSVSTTPEVRQLQKEPLMAASKETRGDERLPVGTTIESIKIMSAQSVNRSTSILCKEEEESPKTVIDTSSMIEKNSVHSNLEHPCNNMQGSNKPENVELHVHKPDCTISESNTDEPKTQRFTHDLQQGFIALEKEWKKSSTVGDSAVYDQDKSIAHPQDLFQRDQEQDEESIGSIEEDDEGDANLLLDFDKPERCEELDDLKRLVEEIDSHDIASKSLFEITPILEEQEDESDEEKSIPETAMARDDSKRFIHDLHSGFIALEEEWKQSSSDEMKLKPHDRVPLSPPKPRRLFGEMNGEGNGDDELSFGSADDDEMLKMERSDMVSNREQQHLDDNVDVNNLDFVFDQMMDELDEEENLHAIKSRNASTDDTPKPEEADDKSIESNSMFSQSDSSEYQSLGPYSTSGRSMGFSICDLSIGQSTTDIIVERNQNLRSSSSLTNNGLLSNSFKKNKAAKPTGNNAFETLPRHLIKTSLIQQAVITLRDERFLSRRISKLGVVYAAKVHVLDFVCMYQKITKDIKKIETERSSLEASIPSTAYFADGEDFDSIAIDSFEIFEKCVLEMCGIQMVGFDAIGAEDIGKSNEENMDNDQTLSSFPNNDDTAQIPNVESQTIKPKIILSDGGRALYTIGKYCQKQGWDQDAMEFYKHALYLCFLDAGVEEPRLLDNSDDCDGFFYVQVAREYVHEVSDTHQYIGSILTKMGDIHGKCDEKNDALRAYKASEVFLRKYISDLNLENVDDSRRKAAVEALALSFNRVGGVYTAKGELDAALSSFHDALDMQINTLGEDHVEVAKTLHNIGVCHRHKDDWDSALQFYIKAHKIFEKTLGRDHLDTVRTLHNIGGVYRRKRDYTKAMECFKEVLVVRRNALGDDHPSVAITLVSMAAVLRRCGKKKEANKFYAAAVR
jgi:tetratricopeptide (TPR) repeat protein